MTTTSKLQTITRFAAIGAAVAAFAAIGLPTLAALLFLAAMLGEQLLLHVPGPIVLAVISIGTMAVIWRKTQAIPASRQDVAEQPVAFRCASCGHDEVHVPIEETELRSNLTRGWWTVWGVCPNCSQLVHSDTVGDSFAAYLHHARGIPVAQHEPCPPEVTVDEVTTWSHDLAVTHPDAIFAELEHPPTKQIPARRELSP